MAEAVPELGVLTLAIVALGLILLAEALVRGLFGTVNGAVGWIPWVGKVISAPIQTIEQKVISGLGAAEAKVDNAIGQAWHKLADTIVTLAELLVALPILLYQVAKLLGQLVISDVTHGEATKAARSAAADALAQARHGIDRVRSTTDELGRGIDAVAGRVGALEHETADVLSPALDTVRGQVGRLEGEAVRTWDEVVANGELLGLAAFTGAVAVALEELGSGWIRCEANQHVGRKLCGIGPGLIKALLEGALGALTIGELCNLSKLLVKVAQSGPIQSALTVVTTGMTDLFRCQGVSRARPYKLPPLSVGKPQPFAQLAPPSV